MPAHAGGEVVEPEEVGQFVGVLGAPLHGVEEGELAVEQDLVAAGEVDEDLGDSAAQLRLLDGGLDGGALEGVEGLADLADLVLPVAQVGHFGGDVDLFACGEPAHDAGQADPGDLLRLLLEAAQVADEVAADADGDDDRGEQGEEAEDAGDADLERTLYAAGWTRSW